MLRCVAFLLLLSVACAASDQGSTPSLTVYNQNFAVVRQDIPLDLSAGINNVVVNDITMHLEPDSVILRDPAGKRPIDVLEQNYRADPVSDSLLLSLFEGKTIEFMINQHEVVKGKVIRSGYTPHNSWALRRYGQQYYQTQMAYAGGSSQQPIIEVEGRLRFGLPGVPLFPSLGDGTILKPSLQWLLSSPQAGPVRAELSYVTGGLTWEADYNVVAPETGDSVDLVGWITIDNQSGKTFENARIKLMAGDVSKIQPGHMRDGMAFKSLRQEMTSPGAAVTEKPLTSTTCIHSPGPPPCMTARQSRLNSLGPHPSAPSEFTCTTESKSITTATPGGTGRTFAVTPHMAPNPTPRSGSCGSS
ncbi:MAG TPA: hypothetical protein VD837_12900 [Terriglobales bacterium]|nr:hypothetical protein [Terriglobales bacterium]